MLGEGPTPTPGKDPHAEKAGSRRREEGGAGDWAPHLCAVPGPGPPSPRRPPGSALQPRPRTIQGIHTTQ